MKNDELSYNLGDTVDRLISVQYFLSGGGSALTRKPVTGVLYEAAREKAGATMGLVDPFTGLAFGWDDFPVDKNVNELVTNLIRYMLAVRVVPRWYNDSIMGPSQKWIHERSFAENLVTRWAKSIIDSEKDFFAK